MTKESQNKLNCYCADHVGALGLVSDAQCMDSCGKVKVGVLLCGMNDHNVYSVFQCHIYFQRKIAVVCKGN